MKGTNNQRKGLTISKFEMLMGRLYASPAYRNGNAIKRWELWVKVMNFTDNPRYLNVPAK